MSPIEDMARCLAEADGHDPDLLCRLDIPPPYKINTPEGIASVYDENEWRPIWTRYTHFVKLALKAGLIPEEPEND